MVMLKLPPLPNQTHVGNKNYIKLLEQYYDEYNSLKNGGAKADYGMRIVHRQLSIMKPNYTGVEENLSRIVFHRVKMVLSNYSHNC